VAKQRGADWPGDEGDGEGGQRLQGGRGGMVNSRNKVVVASLIGTAIEFFDFYIYATAAVIVFPHG
jgi:hypothetical protein